jgi:hypothetical protein
MHLKNETYNPIKIVVTSRCWKLLNDIAMRKFSLHHFLRKMTCLFKGPVRQAYASILQLFSDSGDV